MNFVGNSSLYDFNSSDVTMPKVGRPKLEPELDDEAPNPHTEVGTNRSGRNLRVQGLERRVGANGPAVPSYYEPVRKRNFCIASDISLLREVLKRDPFDNGPHVWQHVAAELGKIYQNFKPNSRQCKHRCTFLIIKQKDEQLSVINCPGTELEHRERVELIAKVSSLKDMAKIVLSPEDSEDAQMEQVDSNESVLETSGCKQEPVYEEDKTANEEDETANEEDETANEEGETANEEGETANEDSETANEDCETATEAGETATEAGETATEAELAATADGYSDHDLPLMASSPKKRRTSSSTTSDEFVTKMIDVEMKMKQELHNLGVEQRRFEMEMRRRQFDREESERAWQQQMEERRLRLEEARLEEQRQQRKGFEQHFKLMEILLQAMLARNGS